RDLRRTGPAAHRETLRHAHPRFVEGRAQLAARAGRDGPEGGLRLIAVRLGPQRLIGSVAGGLEADRLMRAVAEGLGPRGAAAAERDRPPARFDRLPVLIDQLELTPHEVGPVAVRDHARLAHARSAERTTNSSSRWPGASRPRRSSA